MVSTIKSLLNSEITSELSNLAHMQPGTEEHTTAVDNVVKLYRLKIEDERAEMDAQARILESGNDERVKQKQLKGESIGRYLKLGVDVASIILPLAFYGVWMGRGFKFEETGTFTSTTFRGLFNRFRPTSN